MLRAVGHDAAAVLDGGLAAWSGCGGTLEAGRVEPSPTAPSYPGHLDSKRLASCSELRASVKGDAPLVLLDAREPARFRGELEPIDPVAGHIPGSLNAFHAGNLTLEGRFKSPAALRERYGLEEGTEILVEETDEGLLLRPAVTLPIEMYSKERRAAFLLENAIDRQDYERARQEVRKMGLDPDAVPHESPPT